MSEDILLVSTDDHIVTLTLNRPARRNCLSLELIGRLTEAIREMGSRADVRVIVIAAKGPGFCAGHDLKELTAARKGADRGRAFFERTMNDCAAMMQAIVNCPRPVIASVGGIATAAGCQLVASCDLAVATDTASFATPGVHIGLFCSTPMVALSRNVGRKHAMEMLLTGAPVTAEDARAMGLLNRVVPANRLVEETAALAQTIAAKSPAVVRIGKEAFYAQAEMPLNAAYDYAARVMVDNMLHGDAEEGIGAFLEKRAPRWSST